MREKRFLQNKRMIGGVSFLAFFFLFTGTMFAEIPALSSKVIVDSKEPFACRVYAYDFDVDSKGNIHIVYSNPTLPDCSTSQIRYVRRIDGVWQPPIAISNNGRGRNLSTFLEVGQDDTIHICYIGVDNAPHPPRNLHYVTVSDNGVKGQDIVVAPGGWHTRMQLDEEDHPIFIREGETYPGKVSKLTLHTTIDNLTWIKQYIDVPDTEKFRIADFLYKNGMYHLTYGGSEHSEEVWDSARMENRVDGIFHELHYASSLDGDIWSHRIIDDSKKLREVEFWTSLVVDGNIPIASRYRYEEAANTYNLGTSANLMTFSGSSLKKKIITDKSYEETREGMGVGLLVNNPGDYFGVWDLSPPQPLNDDFSGAAGNIALYRNGPNDDWSLRGQIAPFSIEGRGILKKYQNRIFFLALGNYTDAKLYFFEYDLHVLDELMPPKLPKNSENRLNQGVFLLLLGQ